MLTALTLAVALAQGTFPVAGIRVNGNVRFSAEAVTKAAGLVLEQQVTPADLDAACKRLASTGLIESARYAYKPAGGGRPAYDVTFEIAEAGDLQDTRIEIPGVEEAQAWKWLEENDPLVMPRMPGNDAAIAYYTRAIERFLATRGRTEPIVSKLRAGASGAVVTVFRPANLPRIAAVWFEGNRSIDSPTLEKAIAPALGSDFSESGFRELLDFNVRPLYEEQGRLQVQWKRLGIQDGTVAVAIEEGPVYRVGTVEVAGERLPVPGAELAKLLDARPGEPANWSRIAQAANAIQAALGRFGYLDAAAQIDRNLDDSKGRVDVIVSIQKGSQYVFGALRLAGLDAQSEARARGLWRLAPGAIMNLTYLDEFERTLMRDDKIHFKRITRHYEPRAGSNVVDVTFTFKP